MNNQAGGPHWSFWLIAIVIAVWHFPAIVDVLWQMGLVSKPIAGDAASAILENRPVWASIAFAVFAIAGLLGSLMLFLRRRFAIYLFVISLAGVLVHMVGLFAMSDVPAPMKMGCVMSLVGAVIFIGYCRYAVRKGWLR